MNINSASEEVCDAVTDGVIEKPKQKILNLFLFLLRRQRFNEKRLSAWKVATSVLVLFWSFGFIWIVYFEA